MYKRYELHNHTTESDSDLTVKELLDYMADDRVDCFALTDHNTISGHRIVRDLLKDRDDISCIYGMEYTTYYGHILCLNLFEYVPWENINLHCPERLFKAVRRTGALTGIAHPFSYGHPFARGCRFDMTVNDYSDVNFIEIFNDPEPLHEVNERGLLMWEDLVLSGLKLAATCGMDLHGRWNMGGQYATYCEGEPKGDCARELEHAILNCRTWVSKGLVPVLTVNEGVLSCKIVNMHKPGFEPAPGEKLILSLRSTDGTRFYEVSPEKDTLIYDPEIQKGTTVIPKLFIGSSEIENLVAVAPVIY